MVSSSFPLISCKKRLQLQCFHPPFQLYSIMQAEIKIDNQNSAREIVIHIYNVFFLLSSSRGIAIHNYNVFFLLSSYILQEEITIHDYNDVSLLSSRILLQWITINNYSILSSSAFCKGIVIIMFSSSFLLNSAKGL